MPHIIVSKDKVNICINGHFYNNINFAIINGNSFHSVFNNGNSTFIFLVFPFTELYYKICNYLKEKNISDMSQNITETAFSSINFCSVEDCNKFLNLYFKDKISTSYDERIRNIITKIADGSYISKTVEEIAKDVNLSKSRLEHLFTEQTHFRLKYILLIYKFKNAYFSIINGTNITQAAYDSGFSDSAHLAKVAKELTGISISSFLKNIADF